MKYTVTTMYNITIQHVEKENYLAKINIIY